MAAVSLLRRIGVTPMGHSSERGQPEGQPRHAVCGCPRLSRSSGSALLVIALFHGGLLPAIWQGWSPRLVGLGPVGLCGRIEMWGPVLVAPLTGGRSAHGYPKTLRGSLACPRRSPVGWPLRWLSGAEGAVRGGVRSTHCGWPSREPVGLGPDSRERRGGASSGGAVPVLLRKCSTHDGGEIHTLPILVRACRNGEVEPSRAGRASGVGRERA